MAADDGGWGNQGGGEDQDFAFDGSEYSRDDIASGDSVDKEGWYHFEVVNVKNELDTLGDGGKEKSPCIVLTMNVLETVKGQCPAGSKYFHRVYVAAKGGAAPKEGAVKSALRFGLGLNLLEAMEKDGREVIVDAATKSTRIPASIWQRAMGRQCIAKIVLEKSDNPQFKDKYAIQFGRAYHPLDPSVADVAKNKEALAMLGGQGAPAPPPDKSKSAGNQQLKQQTQAPAKPAPPADDDLSDL